MIIKYPSSGNKFFDALFPIYVIFLAILFFASMNEIFEKSDLNNILIIIIYLIVGILFFYICGVIWYKIIEFVNRLIK